MSGRASAYHGEQWSDQKRASVAQRYTNSPHWFERAALSARTIAEQGDPETARSALLAAIETAESIITDHYHPFEELCVAALLTHNFDFVQRIMFLRNQHPWELSFKIVDRTNPHPYPLVLWEIGQNHSSFTFEGVHFAAPFIEGICRVWLRAFPLYDTYMRQGDEIGQVPLSLWDAGIEPGVAFCAATPDYFLVPDPDFISHDGHKDARDHFLAHHIAWEDRQPIALWRGSTTGRAPDWSQLPRIKLCKIAQQIDDPSLLDAGITAIAQIVDPEARALIEASGLMKPWMDWRTFNCYKYHIDIDGNSNAWPGLFQKLLTGSPVLKVASEHGYRQWYYDQLRPWTNFVPVSEDMEDIVAKIRWLRRNDDRAMAIGAAGRGLALSLDYHGELQRAVPVIEAALRYANFNSDL